MAKTPDIAVSSAAVSGPVSRPSQGLGRILRRQLAAGLAQFRSPLASCPDSQSRGGFGGGDEESDRASRPAVLMLEVARLDSRMEIVDVPREKRRRATEAFMACARNVLRGRVIDVPAARAGGRMHIAFHLGNDVSPVAE